ncbi:MAG: Lrp/AsnC family transcriptional regulator [Candidatus Hodarchaeota archaeon]
MKLTKKDRKLAWLLRQNPRIQFKELGSLLNVSDVAARKRFLSLQERGLLCVELIVPIADLSVFFGRLDAASRDLYANRLLLERASKCPRIRFSGTTTGEYNFSAIFSAEGMDALRSCVDHFRVWNRDEILKDQFILITSISQPKTLAVPITEDNSTPIETKSEILHFLTQEAIQEPCGANCSLCDQFNLQCSGCPSRSDWVGLI